MDVIHIKKVERLRELLKFFKNKKKVLNKVIADFAKKHHNFIVGMEALEAHLFIAGEDITIYTRQKNETRDKIEEEMELLIPVLKKSYNKRHQLYPVGLDVSKSDLHTLDDVHFQIKCEKITEGASNYLDVLPQYGFDKNRTYDLIKLVNYFKGISNLPLLNKQVKKANGMEVLADITKLEVLLTGIDNWIKAIKDDYPEICEEYEMIRRGKKIVENVNWRMEKEVNQKNV